MSQASSSIPLLLEPDQLEQLTGQESLVIIDLSKPENYNKFHIPAARQLNYNDIVREQKPVMGLVPDQDQLLNCLSQLGISNDTHVVAYDDEGGGKAARFLWTLDLLNHKHYSLLNGGIFSWANEDFPLSADPVTYSSLDYQGTLTDNALATKSYILNNLQSENTVLLDTRTPEEFQGIKKYAERGGHIPGAVNLDWVEAMDKDRNLRLKSKEILLDMLAALKITEDKQVITYCQTHHRSSHTYFVLKYLGFKQIKGYAGAWSEWGNDPSTPIET